MKIKYLIAIAIFFSIIKTQAQTWTGQINSDWNNSANWTGWPLTGDDIIIDPANYTGVAASPVISSNSVFTPAGLIVQNGATVTVQANLTTTKRIELFNNGTLLTVSSGTLFASGSGSQGRFIVSDGAAVIQNNGLVKANQRVIVELGGTYTLNNGTVNPLQELAIGDGNALGSSLFDMNGGTLIMSQGIGFENEAGLYDPTLDMSGGTLSVGGDIGWLGVAPGLGTPRFIMSGGTGTVGGSILNDPATTVNLYMHITGTASLSVNGPGITLVNVTDSIKQSGTSLLTFSNANVISNPGVWFGNGGTSAFNGNTSLQGTGSYQMNHVTIQAAGTLNHQTTSNLVLVGNLINNGTFNPNTNTVVFSGVTPQSISGASFTTFRNLVLSNTSNSGLTLNKAVTVTGALQLNNGKLNSSLVNLITLSDNATSNVGSANSFVNGPLKKTGNDAFVFPVGKNNVWRRVGITAPASVNSEFVAEYFNQSYPLITPVNTPLQAVTNIEYWSLTRFNSTDAVQPSFYWEDANASAITNCTQLSVGYWNGNSWDNIPSTSSGTCTGNGAGFIQAVSPTGNFGNFTFGFTGIVTTQNITICNGGTFSVGTHTYNASGTYIDVLTTVNNTDSTVVTQLTILPVIVKNQSVSLCSGQILSVGAATYSVTGNYSYTLTSVNGCDSIVNTALVVKNPVDVSILQNGIRISSLNTNATAYQWLDCSANLIPLSGQTSQTFTASSNGSYAVAITENGCKDTSICLSIVEVNIAENQTLLQWTVYPNPTHGIFTLELAADAHIEIADILGKVIIIQNAERGKNSIDLSHYDNGVYVLLVSNNGLINTTKIIKH